MNRLSRIGLLFATAMLAAALGACPVARAQRLAVKTNVLHLGLATPDLGLEVVTGEHTSISLSAFGNKRPYGKDIQLLVIQPEFRYWFNGRPLIREYVGVTAFGASYDLTMTSHVFKGNALGIGFTGGYVFALGQRLNIELGAGTGLLFFRQKKYLSDDRYDQFFAGEPSTANDSGYKLFPVKLEISVSYILF